MRVLQFRWLCDTGGVSTSMLLLGRELGKRNIECEYWFCRRSNRTEEFETAGPTTVAPLGYLAARLARGDFDVVQMSSSDPAAELVARMARPARVIVTNRGALSDLWNHDRCFAFTAVSEAMARINQPYTDLQIEVIRNAVDLERFSPPPARESGAPIVAFVGRTAAEEKDFPRFTRIARHLTDRGARIWIADPHESGWGDFAGIALEQIPFERWGRVPFAEMPAFYRAIAASGGALLMTSRTEAFGNAAVEAAASGAITVAPALLGLREAVVDGKTGALFDPAASDATAAELVWRTMASAPAPAAVAAAAAEFSPSKLADAYVALYQRSEQRRVTSVAPPATDAGMDVMIEHLARQKNWRAEAELESAASLAARGYPLLALTAVRLALSAAPRRVLGGRGLRHLLSALSWVARRPDRLLRHWSLRGATYAVPPAS